jgi:hypothetical protein
MLRLLTLAWSLSVRLTCWLSRRRVLAIDRARARVQGEYGRLEIRSSDGKLLAVFRDVRPFDGIVDVQPVDWAGRERRIDA